MRGDVLRLDVTRLRNSSPLMPRTCFRALLPPLASVRTQQIESCRAPSGLTEQLLVLGNQMKSPQSLVWTADILLPSCPLLLTLRCGMTYQSHDAAAITAKAELVVCHQLRLLYPVLTQNCFCDTKWGDLKLVKLVSANDF